MNGMICGLVLLGHNAKMKIVQPKKTPTPNNNNTMVRMVLRVALSFAEAARYVGQTEGKVAMVTGPSDEKGGGGSSEHISQMAAGMSAGSMRLARSIASSTTTRPSSPSSSRNSSAFVAKTSLGALG